MVPASYANVLYVDGTYGNDATAQRGCAALPFQTIQAALNAMTTDDTVELAPQLFTIGTTLVVPATVVRGACVGSGFGANPNNPATSGPATSLFSATTDIWNFGTNLGIGTWCMADLSMRTNLAGRSCILADGSSYAKGTFFAVQNGLVLRNTFIRSVNPAAAISAKYAASAALYNVTSNGGTLLFTTCGSVSLNTYNGPGATITATNDSSDALCQFSGVMSFSVIHETHVGTSAFGSGLVIGGQTSLNQDETSTIGLLSGAALSVNGAVVPACVCSGWIGAIDFDTAGKEIPDTALVLSFIFQGVRLYQNGFTTITAAVVKAKVAGAAANFQSVNLDSTTTVPLAAITANTGIHITGRGARWPNSTLSTPGVTGDINPPSLYGVIDLSAGGTVAKTWSQLGFAALVRTGVAPTAALATASAQLSDVAITARNTTGLTFASNNIIADNAADWGSFWP